jgi:hypothetical protein
MEVINIGISASFYLSLRCDECVELVCECDLLCPFSSIHDKCKTRLGSAREVIDEQDGEKARHNDYEMTCNSVNNKRKSTYNTYY